jgi:hypothetical protein
MPSLMAVNLGQTTASALLTPESVIINASTSLIRQMDGFCA